MEDLPTPLSLPGSLPYPLTVTRLLAQPGSSLNRGSPLLEYQFTSDTSRKALLRRSQSAPKQEGDDDARENDMVGSWESPIEGQLLQWFAWIRPGTVIERKHAGKEIVSIQQPCTHPVQLHGMCGVCGADLTTDDYLSRPTDEASAGPSKKGFEMSHDSLGVTVSTNAKRLENQARDTLLHERKLSLIVDLDQTIIHTTVDPTVGEWMAEIEKERESVAKPDESTTPPGSPSNALPGKEKNPNADALEDVARFQLSDDLPPGYNPKTTKGRPPGLDRWYYTKPRPGLERFLKQMNKSYEMHVYTMGTRTYADAICKVVDPTGQYFGDRIISRDESGSFNSKSLKRLFPTDQSMVVVIDDRADVWGDIANLVKVVPYDFFLGIGDINSSFLPPNPNKPVPTAPGASPETNPSSPESPEEESDEPSVKTVQTKLLDQLSEERPLAKLQEQLDADAAKEAGEGGASEEAAAPDTAGDNEDKKSTTPPGSPAKPRKPLLNPHDDELERIAGILSRIHSIFYEAYDSRKNRSPTAPLPLACDVETIIPDIKSTVLEGCTIVFTGVIARHERPENSVIFAQAEAFGAQPVVELSPDVTHCVTAVEGTEKAILARRMGIPVLWVGWFHRCVALWERVDDHDWLVNPPRDAPKTGVETRPASGEATPASGSLGLEGTETGNGAGAKGWDEAYQKELEELLNGDSDDSDDDSDAGSVATSIMSENRSRAGSPLKSALASPGGSPPGTPRKRVRYADEESLPLESFKELPQSDGPPKKKKKPLLLGAPSEDDDIPEANKMGWKGKLVPLDPEDVGPAGEGLDDGAEEKETEEREADQGQDEHHVDHTASSDAGTEDDDDFARMLADSMDE